MNLPLMPKATAVWLVENTTLTFKQISEFCGMHPMEIQGIADGDVAVGMIGVSPVSKGQITQENLDEAEKDEKVELKLTQSYDSYITSQKKVKNRYTPVARRQDKPDAVSWIIKNHPTIKDTQISKLIGTTKSTIQSIRSREHWNIQNIHPRDPVLLGLCTQTALFAVIEKTKKADENAALEAEKVKAKAKKKKEKEKEAKKV